jgi:hypothetical protein
VFYIHQTSCISPQQTFRDIDINTLHESVEKKLFAIEPSYEGIPAGVLRRMGKSVRMGVGATMPIFQNYPKPDGIIIGSASSGKDDCIKFLNQIIDYDEGMLTPMNFVQSTPNALAAQIGLLTNNHGYNITHLHLGLSFEFAMIDADMMLHENPSHSYLLGAVDDISTHNYYFEDKGGWYKKEVISNKVLYESISPGSIAGEAATVFLVNKTQTASLAKVLAVDSLHSEDEMVLKEKLQDFLKKNLPAGEKIDLLLTGENGDHRLMKYYSTCESELRDVTIARFKHMSGEYPTATAMGLWLCCEILKKQNIPQHMIKKDASISNYKNVLMYNNFKGIQHSFILLSD